MFIMKKVFSIMLIITLLTSCIVIKPTRKSCGLPKHKHHHKSHYHRF